MRRNGPRGARSGRMRDEDDEYESAGLQRRKRALLGAAAYRRRLVLAFRLLLAQSGKGPQGPKRKEKSPFIWLDHVARLTWDQFRLRYRLDIRSFYSLLGIIRSSIETDACGVRTQKRFKAKVVPPEVKLAICLRYLAGASVLDLFLIYHVDQSYVYDCVWLVVDAINERLKVEFPLLDVPKLRVLEAEFRAASRGGIWRGQVGAVDGVHFAMRAPSKKDVRDPMRYFVAHKNEYALLCMAMCDARRRITFYDISQAPTTHDSLAWACSSLGLDVANGKLPSPFFINGDSAFSLSNSMIVPSGDPDLDDFDFHQSSNRMAIECAFGMIVRRWGILWRPLEMRFDRRAPLIGAIIRLHNFCIDRGVTEFKFREKSAHSEVIPNRWLKTPLFDKEGRPIKHLDIDWGECLNPTGYALSLFPSVFFESPTGTNPPQCKSTVPFAPKISRRGGGTRIRKMPSPTGEMCSLPWLPTPACPALRCRST